MENTKNTCAIDKIIAELSLQDYHARTERLTSNQKKAIRNGKKTLSDFGGYSLGQKTMEAVNVKRDYLNGNITENEYKAWCLRYNLAYN